MIKARAGNTVIFGLSRKNIEKLTEGKPIAFDGEQVNMDGYNFVIMFGETEQDILTELHATMKEAADKGGRQ
jgi:hypothetical protein